MPIRKVVYCVGDEVLIRGCHVFHGRVGEVVGKGILFGTYHVKVDGKTWVLRGRNLRAKEKKASQ